MKGKLVMLLPWIFQAASIRTKVSHMLYASLTGQYPQPGKEKTREK